MTNDDLDDFFFKGGDELLNTEECLHYGEVIYLDHKIERVDEENKIAKCPKCRGEVKIDD